MPRQSPPSVVTTLRHTVRAGLVPHAVVLVITGMGPPALPAEGAVASKLFALQPVFARVLHIFHLDDA